MMIPSRLLTSTRLSSPAAACAGTILLFQFVLAPAYADPSTISALLVEKHCNACHDVNAVLIGPPYIAVAIRHGADVNQDSTVEVLAHKIVLGGGGNWGNVPMVPNGDRVTLDQSRSIARWILSLRPPT